MPNVLVALAQRLLYGLVLEIARSGHQREGRPSGPVHMHLDARVLAPASEALEVLGLCDLSFTHDEQSPARLQVGDLAHLGAFSVAAAHRYTFDFPVLAMFSRNGIAP
jgi:hypothetical protein